MQDDEIRLGVPAGTKARHLEARNHDELIRQPRPEALQQSLFTIVLLGNEDDVGGAAGHGPSMATFADAQARPRTDSKGAGHN